MNSVLNLAETWPNFGESLGTQFVGTLPLAETVGLAESLGLVALYETMPFTEALTTQGTFHLELAETVPFAEALGIGPQPGPFNPTAVLTISQPTAIIST
jgi:hypothetical protein